MTEGTENTPARSPGRILVIDDEPALSKVTRTFLERLGGYTVCEVNFPTDAIKIAREFKPDLVLMDVVMPMLTGPELAEKMRKLPEFSEVPILFLTSTVARSEAGTGAMESNGEQFLSKPIVRDVLLKTVADALSGKSGG